VQEKLSRTNFLEFAHNFPKGHFSTKMKSKSEFLERPNFNKDEIKVGTELSGREELSTTANAFAARRNEFWECKW
jgi:hypothetical protein